MSYFDAILVAVPRSNRAAALEFSRVANGPWLEHGALRVVRGWGVEGDQGNDNGFRRAVAAKDDEDVVCGWVEWPDRATRDAAMAKMMSADRPNIKPPFDATRTIFAGFEMSFDSNSEPM